MKIYFTAAVSNISPEVRKLYGDIIKALESQNHTVIGTHLLNKNEEVISKQSEEEALSIQRKMSKWKKQADLMVVEVSTPSFGVGQEIAEAIADNRQVVAMYLKGRKPHILSNQGQDLLYLVEYTPENLALRLSEYVDFAKAHSDTRFNFFISPQIGGYLDWISRKRKIPRAVYLRRLIEDDMKDNEDYQGS
ncbi:MAG: hypothetical protein ABII80_03545 [bacterium]